MNNKIRPIMYISVFISMITAAYAQNNLDTTCTECQQSGIDTIGLKGWVETINDMKKVFKPENWVSQPYDKTEIKDEAKVSFTAQDFTNSLRVPLQRRTERFSSFLLNRSDANPGQILDYKSMIRKKSKYPEAKLMIIKIVKSTENIYKVYLGTDNHFVNISTSGGNAHLITDDEFQKTLNWLIK